MGTVNPVNPVNNSVNSVNIVNIVNSVNSETISIMRTEVCSLVVMAAVAVGQLQVQDPRDGRAQVVKKVRRLRPDGSDLNSCPMFDGVQVYAGPDSCNRFYKCENGTMSLDTCENGLLFDQDMALTDGIHNYCVYNWRVDCGDRRADNTKQSSPGCEYKFGLFPKDEGCHSSYIKCEHGTPTEMPCEAENPNVPVVLGLAYDPDLHSCDWPDLLTHRGCDPAERLGDFTCPSLTEIQGTFNERFSLFPRFAVSDPRVYIICVDTRPRLQSCGAHDEFDRESLT